MCVDDGSTDDTSRVLAGFVAADPRFRVLRQENSGVAIALTRGDAAARGEWIARMDSDDVAVPTRLEKQLAFVDANPDCVGLGGAVMVTDPTGAPLGRSSYATEHEAIEREDAVRPRPNDRAPHALLSPGPRSSGSAPTGPSTKRPTTPTSSSGSQPRGAWRTSRTCCCCTGNTPGTSAACGRSRSRGR